MDVPKTGNGKWWAGFAATFAATYVVDHLQREHGVDFKEMGTDPAIMKSLVEGSFVSFFVWISPSHIVESVTDVILFVKTAIKNWHDAINN